MAISSTAVSTSYTGNGATVAFPTGFKFAANADVTVKVGGVTKTLGVDYSLVGAGVDAGGTVTFGAAPANAAAIVFSRSTPITQPVAFGTGGEGNFSPKTHEGSFDRGTMISQELDARLDADEAELADHEARISALEAGGGGGGGGASVASGSINFAAGVTSHTVAFDVAQPDTAYYVSLGFGIFGTFGDQTITGHWKNKTVNGFDIVLDNIPLGDPSGHVTVDWIVAR